MRFSLDLVLKSRLSLCPKFADFSFVYWFYSYLMVALRAEETEEMIFLWFMGPGFEEKASSVFFTFINNETYLSVAESVLCIG